MRPSWWRSTPATWWVSLPDPCSGKGHSELPGAEQAGWQENSLTVIMMLVQLGLQHLDADGDWGQETTTLGLRIMTVLHNSHSEGTGTGPRPSHRH